EDGIRDFHVTGVQTCALPIFQSVDSPQTVDLGLIVSKSMDNPVFYVQMAHARLCSVDKVAAERGIVRPPLDSVDLSPLTQDRERSEERRVGKGRSVGRAPAAS